MKLGIVQRAQQEPDRRMWYLKYLVYAIVVTCAAFSIFPAVRISSSQGDVPDRQFFEDYIKNKASTFFQYQADGIEPFLSMTLANNRAFKCITSAGREVDFDGYVEIYKYTFGNFVYDRISPVKVKIEQVNDDEIVVTYTMSMAGRVRGALRWEVERDNKYTFLRIKADDTGKLRELDPQNLEKYFEEHEDKWIITRIQYG
jgi:hypothetical protein